MLGILGAIEAEVVLLREHLTDRVDRTVAGVDLHEGCLDGHRVLLARSGVGKVNAAHATSVLITCGVDEVLFTGVAGGIGQGLRIGDVVVGSDCVQHDVDVTSLGRPAGELLGEPLSWPCDPALVARLRRAAEEVVGGATVHVGRIASGDQFVASSERAQAIRETFDALAAEMEGAATAQVCHRAGVPCAIVRSLSDTADETADVDFPAFLTMASRRGLALTRALLASPR